MSFMPENLNFADFLVDDDNIINNSPPISFPSQNSEKENENDFADSNISRIRPPKHTGQQGEFRSIEEIDSKYRHIFTYPYFNLVQSRVIEDTLYSDKSMVVCAPTGSGKTVVFEMAIAQLLMDLEDKSYTGDFKIIYMAPVKALCTERLTEWYPKFTKLGLLCIEVTGDTDVDFPQLKPYSIIITTPEKWDMLTRRWKDHKGLVEVVKLFLIDEVHILNDDTRGPVLEAVVSRMKTIEASVQSAHRIEQLHRQYKSEEPTESIITPGPRIRFVAVSATVNNPEDVAAWLGTPDKPAVYYKFGDECRPVKLKRVVEGYPCPEGTSIFKFDIILNYKLWPIIQKYHNGKPTLIFCNTRKSVALTAEALSREITITFKPEQKAKLTALAATLKNKKLQALILNGVGCHHAGLLFEERMNIEHAFRNRDLPILITTTTLAMGVNLPAHLVIIKNTQQYVNGTYQEYSISTILQMVGRAGRPQYDTEATAVIMTRMADKARYQALVGGTEPLESFLHKRLAENLNSEAALGTVTDVAQCVQWLNSTFLSVRAAKDPKRYLGLSSAAPANQISKKIEELCVIAMNGLASSGLITMDEASCIESTDAGKLMSVYYIDLETMKLIMKIEGSESLERLLWLLCECHELSDMHLRQDERRCLNALNRNSTAATIRFPMKGKINSRPMKLNCVIQAVLGCLPITEPSLNQEAMKIMRIADRVCKCLVAYTTRQKSVSERSKTFSAVLNSIILAKCIAAHLWENSPYVSKQLKGIGPTFSALLASAGKVNFMLLEESHPRDLERIMNKGPPVGNVLRKQISLLPKYQLTLTPIDRDRVQINLVLLNQSYLSENIEHLTAGPNHKCYMIVGDSENYLLYLNSFKDSDLIRVYDGCITCEVTRKHNHEHKIMAYCISSNFVGIDAQREYLFKSIEPIYYNGLYNNTMNLCEGVSKGESMTELTDERTLIERKRKPNKNDITCSKEKIKRENTLFEKFKYLKDSFGKTSKEIMGNLNKTSERTNDILKTLSSEPALVNYTNDDHEREKKVVSIDLTDQNTNRNLEDIHIAHEKLNTDEIFEHLVDDDQINNILQEIESEIGNNIERNSTRNVKPCNISNSNGSKALKQSQQYAGRLNQKNCVKSNFHFISQLETSDKFEQNNPDIVELNDNESGFANAVKSQLDKYLQNVSNANTHAIDIKNLLNMEHEDDLTIDIEVFPKPMTATVNTEHSSDNKSTSAIQNPVLESYSSENLAMNKQLNFEIPDKNTVDRHLNNSQVSPHKSDLFHNPHGSKCQGSPDLGIDSNSRYDPNDNNLRDEDAIVNDAIKNIEGDANLNHPIAATQPKTVPSNIFTKRPSLHVQRGFTATNIIDPQTSTVADPRENMNAILFHTKHEANSLLNETGYDNTKNTDEILNEKQREQRNRHIENYSFKTEHLNICTKRNPMQTIQIIRKLKIDLDVTKIISTNSCPFKGNRKEENNEHDIINDEPELSNYWKMAVDEQPNCNEEESTAVLEDKELEHKEDNNINVFQRLTPLALTNTQESNFHTQNNEKCTNVKDLITKYSRKLKSSRKTISPSASATKQVTIANNIKPSVMKPKRRYKIKDIQNIDIDLPKISLADNNNINLKSQITETGQSEICRDDNISHDLKVPVDSNISECHMNEPAEISDELNTELDPNIDNLSPEYKIALNSELPAETCDINNAFLNPKILLQCYDTQNNYDSDEVIPPPPEYADIFKTSPKKMNTNNAYSPCSPIFGSETDYSHILDNQDDSTGNTNIFYSFSQNTDLTPAGEIETWTLSREDNSSEYNILRNCNRSFTMMHNNLPVTKLRKCFPDKPLSNKSSRNVKLQEFKFVRKNLLKIKK